jgi:hypothetical protein
VSPGCTNFFPTPARGKEEGEGAGAVGPRERIRGDGEVTHSVKKATRGLQIAREKNIEVVGSNFYSIFCYFLLFFTEAIRDVIRNRDNDNS